MKQLRSFFGVHKLFTAVCVLFCCAVLSVAMAVSGFAYADTGKYGAQAYSEASEATPLKPYTSIEVTVPDELYVYKGITTVSDLKNDITVTGTYSGGMATLENSEFSVINGSEVLNDNAFIVADGEEVSAVQLYIESGSASFAQLPTLTVKSSEDIPEYAELTLKNAPSIIESDHTADTLKKLLTVCGDGNVIANKELYTVEVNAPLTLGSTAKVTVTYNGTLTKEFTFGVTAAEFKGIFVTLNENLIEQDGYYKINENIEGTDTLLSAFVKGMTATTMERNGGVWKRFTVYKQYSFSRERINEEGEVSVSAINTDTGLITLAWRPTGETSTYTDSIVVSFEAQRVVAISSATLKDGNKTFYSYTDLRVSDFNITATLNSGESSSIIPDSEFSVDTSLVRYGEELYTNASGDNVYDKKIKISYLADSSVYTQITLNGIIDAGEYTVDMIGGSAVTQKVGEEFDFRGLYAVITYTASGIEAEIKLDERKEEFKKTNGEYSVYFYTNRTGSGTPVNGDGDIVIPNRNVLVAVIEVGNYKANPITISIDPLTLDTPVVDTRDINFTAGVYKSVTGLALVNSDGNSALPVSMRVTVTEDANAAPIATAIYSPDSEPVVTNYDNSAVIYYADGKIEFTRGGLFTVTFELTDTYSDYGWATGSGYVYKLEYKDIRVNKGELDVRITDSDGSEITEIEIEYGTEAEMLAEIANLNLGVKYYTYGGTPVTDPELTDPDFKFYGFDDFTYVNLSERLPDNAGNGYYMVAVSVETGAYKSSTTLGEHVVKLTVTPKKINPDDIASAQIYDRDKQYDLTSDVVSIPENLFVSKDIPADGEIVSITTSLTDTVVSHAGKYEITLTVLSKNYVWDGEGASLNANGFSEITTNFEITQYVTPAFTVTNATDFTYGESGFTPAYSHSEKFYPVVSAPEYYTAEYFNSVIAAASGATVLPDVSNALTTDMSVWDSGEYYVFYRTAADSAYNETEADYTLPSAYAKFTVLRKYVGAVSITADGFGGVYDSVNHDYVITIGGKNFADLDGSLGITYTVSGVNGNGGNISVTKTSNGFTLVSAGTYTVTFTGLNRNYTWDNNVSPVAAGSSELTCYKTVTVTPFTLTVTWDETSFTYTGSAHAPNATLDFYTADGATEFTTELYKLTNGKYESVQSAIEAGDYKIVIVSVNSTDYVISGGNEKLFTISKATLDLPDIAAFDGKGIVERVDGTGDLTATYCGNIFSVEAYFDNYNNNVEVEISLGGAYSAEIMSAGTYTVTLTPSGNYVWNNDSANPVTIQFTVLQKEVTLSFTVTDGGNAYVYNGSAFAPTVTLGEVVAGDNVTAETVITSGGVDAEAINAGNYTITVTLLTGDDGDNYKLPEVISCDFGILKKGITAPTLTVSAIEFGSLGDSVVFADSSVWAEIYGKAEAEVTFAQFTDYGNYTQSIGPENSFHVTKNGFGFDYTDAGIYTVEFTLTDGDNYRWGDNGSSVNTQTEIIITVERKRISITGFDTRQFAWQEGGTQGFDFDGVQISEVSAKLTLVKKYGIVTVNGTSVERDYGNLTSEPYTTDKGVYYAYYTLAQEDGAENTAKNNPYNYTWDASSVRLPQTDDNAPLLNMLGGYNEHVIINPADGALVVHYTISSSILKVTVNISGYTYGDNNGADFLSAHFTASGDELSVLQNEDSEGRFTVTVTIYGGENHNDKIGEFTYDSAAKQITEYENTLNALENYLPYNAGDYRAVFTWDFNDQSNYVMANSQCDFTVTPFVLTNGYITWEGELSPVYNGGTHTLTATVNNSAAGLPKRGGVNPDITALTVALSDSGNLPTEVYYKDNAVAAYTLYVISVSGGDADNFTVYNSSGDYAAYASLTVTPRTVYVTGQSVEAHVYGERITESEKQWAYTDADDAAKKFCDNGSYIVVKIYDDGNNEITSSLTAVGTYRVVPELVTECGNYTLSVTEGEFKVVKREITVTADGKSSVYGESISTLTYSIGGMGIADGETDSDVFTLAAKNNGSEISNTTGIGTYAIELIGGDSYNNYDITYTGANYVITPATLSVKVDFEIYFGENAPDEENYKTASMFTVTGFKSDDESDFDISEVINSFTFKTEDYAAGDNAGNYTINFTAENSEWGNYVFENAGGTLTVKKLPLTVAVESVSRDYYAEYKAPTVTLTVTAKSSYTGATLSLLNGVSEGDIVSLITTALNINGENVVLNGVGDYNITCDYAGAASDNYVIENITSATGEYKITAASFDDVVIPDAATLTYAETNLSVLNGKISASASDGKEDSVNIKYTLTDSLNAVLYSGTDVPTVFHAGGYTLTYRIYDARGNYAEISGTISISVGTGVNAFADNNRFAYTVGGAERTYGAATENMAAAWVYGDYNTSKVNASDFVSPSANFDSLGANKLNVEIYFSREYNGNYAKLYSAEIENKNGDILSVLSGVFALNNFGAGYYKITYTLGAYVNEYRYYDYGEVSDTKYLYVSKAELSVKADDASPTEYGDTYEFAASAYGDNHTTIAEGFKYDDGRDNLLNDGAAVTFTWTVGGGYTALSDTGDYAIVINSENNYESDNYTFTFPAGGKVTVTKRVVGITINNPTYDFNTDITLEQAASYTFGRLTAGKENDSDVFVNGAPIKLVTAALTPSTVEGDYGVFTNNAGTYAIYAVWADESYADNYTVVFVDCTMTSADDGAIQQSGEYALQYGEFNAGTFTITPAVLSEIRISVTTVTYNGEQQQVTAVAKISDSVSIEFTAWYALRTQNADGDYVYGEFGTEAPVNAGVYAVRLIFTSASETQNYSVGNLNVTFTIEKQKLFVAIAELVEIEYGTPLPLDYTALTPADRFSGITLKYTVGSSNGAETTQAALTEKEQDKINFNGMTFTTAYTIKSAANSVLNITLGGIQSDNYELEYIGNNIKVLQRNINVTVHGAESNVAEAMKVYDGVYQNSIFAGLFASNNVTAERLKNFFTLSVGWNGESGDDITALGLMLTVSADMLNAGKYYFTPTQSYNANYSITWEGLDTAYYLIKQRELTLSVAGYGSVSENKTPVSNPEIIYGDTPVFTHLLSGWIDGENELTVKSTGGELGDILVDGTSYIGYNAFTYNVGNYTVKYDANTTTLTYLNYYVTIAECGFTITQSPVTVVPASKEFTYDDGNAIEPSITLLYEFGISDSDKESFEANYRAEYTLSYEVIEGGALDGNNKPQTAGTYYVHVSLAGGTSGNYYIKESPFKITVNKKDIEIAWDSTSLSLDTERGSARIIAAYDGSIMYVDYFRYYIDLEAESNITDYTTGANGISYTPDKAGRYEIRIALRDTHNYTLSNAASEAIGGDKTAVILNLIVTSTSTAMTVSLNGWTYGDVANVPEAISENLKDIGTIYFLYALTNITSWDNIDAEHLLSFDSTEHDSSELNDYLSYFGVSGLSAFKTDVPTDAGIYLVRAWSLTTGQNSFIPFEIAQKKIYLPEFAGSADTYTGNRLEYVITLTDDQSKAITVYADCGVSVENGRVVLYTTNAFEAGYSVTFGLVSTNYVWGDGIYEGTSSSVTSQYKWIINKANDTITFTSEDYSVTYGDGYAVEATSKFGGQIYYKYAEKTGGSAPDYNDGAWGASKPEYAGEYWVIAFTSGTDNYNGANSTALLVINKKILYATAYGSMTYLDEFSPDGGAGYGYTLEGFVPGQYATTVIPTLNSVTYVSDYKNELGAGTYALTLKTDNIGIVTGLTYQNYAVMLSGSAGTFTVNPKTVHITVNNRSSYYNEALELGDSGVTVDSAEVSVSDLGLTLSLIGESAQYPNVGHYNITAVCSNKNYTVTVSSGVYTVVARPLRIELTGTISANAGSDYTIGSGLFTLYDTINGDALDRNNYSQLYAGLKFTYMLNNAVISKPAEMGTYVIFVTLDISDPQNYAILNGGGTFTFTVGKHTIDGSLITVISANYADAKLTPVIDFGEYENLKDIFEITEAAGYDYTTVGTHIFYLTIKPSAFTEYKWLSIDTDSRTFAFVIERSNNELTEFNASGWTYGDAPVSPQAVTKFGSPDTFIYTYFVKNGSTYVQLSGVPQDAGTYYVKVTVPESQNWYAFTSQEYAEFTIERLGVNVPVLGITAGLNDVYTGDFLWAQVSGFNAGDMEIIYSGVSNISGSVLMVQAFNAGEYTITFRLVNANYKWNEIGASFDSDGNATVTWIVARKKVAMPTASTVKYYVNGKIIEYLPAGFDSSIMKIEGNKYGYGGSFVATVELTDTVNYEWEDGTDGAITFRWTVSGVNKAFVAAMCTLGGLAAAGLVTASVLYVLWRRKKRIEREELSKLNGEARA